jgi:hypothetical protein
VLATSVAGPLARGTLVLVSAWRDVHEGARAQLLSLPGVCRVDVKPLADSLSVRFVRKSTVELTNLPARDLESVQLESDGAEVSEVRLFDQQHAAFRALTAGRTIDVSLIIGVTQLHEDGIVRVSAQAILAEA